jgi:hypothetical protein
MQHKSGLLGVVLSIIGVGLLLFVFYTAFNLFQSYAHLTLTDFTVALNQVLVAAIQAMFLGIMGWVGSIILFRGVDFIKIDRGVGVVTFKVEKGVGIATTTEELEKSSPESKEGTK